MTTKAVQQKRIRAAEGRVKAAEVKIEQAQGVVAVQTKARDHALAEVKWLQGMPVDDEPAETPASSSVPG